MAKKSSKSPLPITREMFRTTAKPVAVVINGKEFMALAKEFSTGSLGWNLNEKTQIEVGGHLIQVQVGLNLTIVGSKEIPMDHPPGGTEEPGENALKVFPWGVHNVEVIEYRGWKNNLRIANADAELVVTLDVGPRVIRYGFVGGFNVLKNYDSMMGGGGEKEWQIRGGHRFWLAPEDLTRTYFPDNRPVRHEAAGPRTAQLTPPPEEEYGIQKTWHVSLAETGSRVVITLRVTNMGSKPTTLAPWGPTVMAPGGMEIIPLPPKAPRPGHPQKRRSPADFGPNQELVLWPYFDFTDIRWTFGQQYIFLRQDVNKGPTKIGLAHRAGWVGYLNSGVLFVKRLDYREGVQLPGPRHPVPDLLERGHAGDGDLRRAGDMLRPEKRN